MPELSSENLKNYISIGTNISKNPKSISSECIRVENEEAAILRPPTNLTDDEIFNLLPFETVSTIYELLQTPGVYAWMIFQDGTFAAVRVLTMAELRAKHYDLYENFGQKPVVMAGEIIIDEEKNVKYNFSSGTFMAVLKEKYPEKYNENKYKIIIEKLLEDAASIEYSEDSFIKKIVAKRADLQKYKDKGYNVLKFDNMAHCRKYYRSMISGGKDAYMSIAKRTYNAVKRHAPNPVPEFNIWIHQKIEKDKPNFYELKMPVNYFAGGQYGKTRRRRNKFHRRTRKHLR